MTIKVMYDSGKSTQEKRYVRKNHLSNGYTWCRQCQQTFYDNQQGTCDAEDLPDNIREKCDNYDGAFYACEWPLGD